jgi:catalase
MFGRDVPSTFRNYTEKVEGHKVRQRSASFHDHFTQARLFYESLSPPEQRHLIKAARFELGRVESQPIRMRVAALMWRTSPELGQAVAQGIGVDPTTVGQMAAEMDRGGLRETVHQAVAAVKEATDVPSTVHKTVEAVKGAVEAVKDKVMKRSVDRSPAVSQMSLKVESASTRRVAVLVAEGYSHAELEEVMGALTAAGAWPEVVAPRLGEIRGGAGGSVAPVWTFLTGASVLFDAVYVPAGAGALAAVEDAALFVRQAYMHCKAIAASGNGLDVLRAAGVALDAGGQDSGLVLGPSFQRAPDFAAAFLTAIAGHRYWDRELAAADPTATAR